MITGNDPKWSTWIYRALTFLVISCPCALVISIPLTFFAGIGGGSRAGILIKGSNYLEQLSKIKTVAMDKTGTMTKGVFEVSGIHHSSIENEKLLEYAALAESFSTHPISLSIRKAYLDNLIWTIDKKTGEAIPKQPDESQKEKRTLDTSRVESVEEIGGNGVLAIVDKKQIALGNRKLMDRQGVTFKECHHNGTVIHVAIDGVYSGHIVISDVIKPTAKEAIRAMHAEGVNTCIILTGDSKHVAESVGKEIGVDKVYAELLPEDKVSIVEELLSKKTDKSALAFVGDGINDAPVLSRADVGIAMGALGSDAAIEAADIVLMDDDPLKIARAIAISRRCMRIIYENIYFAIGIKVLCLILGTIGLTNMWLAVFADVGVMVLAVLNALRALRLPKV